MNSNNNSEPVKGQFYEIVSKSGKHEPLRGVFMKKGLIPEGRAPVWYFSDGSKYPLYITPGNAILKPMHYTRAASKTRRAGRKSRRGTRRHRR